jgi:AraC-like DNA-binding protein
VPAVDVLGEVLSTLELSSQLYFRAELSAPFAIGVPEERGVIRFHVATGEPCWIVLPGREPVRLAPGDLALVPHGAAHVLADDPERAPRPLAAVLDEAGFDGCGPLVHGGDGARTVLVCGHFAFSEALLHPIVASLPPLLHHPGGAAAHHGWIEPVLHHLEHELRSRRAGHVEVVRRLSEILLIEVLRAHVERAGRVALSALADPSLGRALAALHGRPEADWSLESLARIAGQSRSLFAERFRERMGTTPMKYLAAWRMQMARRLLERPGACIGEVARRVGYASESAFHRSFRDHFGMPPGAWRRDRGAARAS